MVLQRGMPVPVWGKAETGEGLTVTLGDKKVDTKADGEGRWNCTLPAMEAGGPLTLTVGGQETVTVHDVWVGEVWLCAGGSNMAFDVQRAADAEQAIAKATLPRVRLFRADAPARGWEACSPETVADFSAAAYFLGRNLHEALDVPVGLIECAEPRSPITAWMSREALEQFPAYKRLLQRMDRYTDEVVERRRLMDAWWKDALHAVLADDPGTQGTPPAWARADLPEGHAAWRAVELPRDPAKRLEDPWRLPRGVVWFRRSAELPAALAGKALTLRLSFLDAQKDAAFFNGAPLAKAGGALRIPADAVKAGKAVLAVRMVNLEGRGLAWFHTDGAQLRLRAAEGEGLPDVALAGRWLYRVGLRAADADLPDRPPPLPPRPSDPLAPTALFRRRLQPLAPFAVRGAAVYQGEADVSRAADYRVLFPALIEDWRRLWERPKLPVLFVQLAGCARKRDTPGDDLWAELREAQAAALQLPHTAMAVSLDTGHRATPQDKQPVGQRLALLARGKAYGEDIACTGPRYEAMEVAGNRVRIRFTGAEGGLAARGGDPSGMFAIAGPDRRFVWADFKIEGETVLVWSRQVPQPVAVRYAWEHTPGWDLRRGRGWVRLGLLFNKACLPAAPFRTDRWPTLSERRIAVSDR
jgi:sialate O-acetylesterase